MHVSVRSEDKDKWTKNNRESIINKHLLRFEKDKNKVKRKNAIGTVNDI